MPVLELIDPLVATYRILNHTVRQMPEDVLRKGDPSVRTLIRQLRGAELHYSQELKARTTGQAPGVTEDTGTVVLEHDASHDSTAELIAQFGTAREATLSILRALPDEDWDATGDFPRTIRNEVIGVIDRDRQALDTMGRILGEPLTESLPA